MFGKSQIELPCKPTRDNQETPRRDYLCTTKVLSSAALWRGPVNFHAMGLFVSEFISRSSLKWETLLSARRKSNLRLVEHFALLTLKRSNSAIAASMRSACIWEGPTLFPLAISRRRELLSHQFTLNLWILHDPHEFLKPMIFCLAPRVPFTSVKPWKGDLREENWGADLDREFDISAVIHHVVKSLLHVGSKVCPVVKNDATVSGAGWGGKYGSLLSRKLVRKSSSAVGDRVAPWESRVSLNVALTKLTNLREWADPFHPGCFLIITSLPIKMCSLSYMTSGRANWTSGGCTTWIERCLDLMRIA